MQPDLGVGSSTLAVPAEPEIERPKSPSSWVPSYSVSTQGNQPSLEEDSRESVSTTEAAEASDPLIVKDEDEVKVPIIQDVIPDDVAGAHVVQRPTLTERALDETAVTPNSSAEESVIEKALPADPDVSELIDDIEVPIVLADDVQPSYESES